MSAGEPINLEVTEQWRSKTGLDIYEGYGQTETVHKPPWKRQGWSQLSRMNENQCFRFILYPYDCLGARERVEWLGEELKKKLETS